MQHNFRRIEMLDLIVSEWLKQKLMEAFWITLFSALIIGTIWLALDQVGDLPPFVAKNFVHIGG